VARLACTLVVRSTSGEQLPGTKFVVEHASEPMPEIGYVTGPDGAARAGLPPGETSLRFFLPDGGSQVVEVRVRDEVDATYAVILDAKGTDEQ
jgi:hypothetical protein